jgi:hypothetical protein
VWPARGALARAVLGPALAGSQPLLFCGRRLLLPFLRRPDVCGFLRPCVRPLDAYASLRPSCVQRGACELKRISQPPPGALRHCASALRLRSVLQFCSRDSCLLRRRSSCGTALNLRFIKHPSITRYVGGANFRHGGFNGDAEYGGSAVRAEVVALIAARRLADLDYRSQANDRWRSKLGNNIVDCLLDQFLGSYDFFMRFRIRLMNSSMLSLNSTTSFLYV